MYHEVATVRRVPDPAKVDDEAGLSPGTRGG